ncbi:MAG: hypothetical protein AB1758_06725 [Candidatus Eremiobacterota bacterium]
MPESPRRGDIWLIDFDPGVVMLVRVEPDPSNGLDRPSLVRVPEVCTFDRARLASDLVLPVEERLHLGL